jgi:glycosyltransferase involved in cell wall biosynthesis
MFSLLISTRNRREDLLRTLRVMVPAFLPGHEVLVLDDASEDGTAEAVAADFPAVRLLRHPACTGYIVARNELLAAARGELAISLDDDAEIATPGFLDLVAEHFAAHPRCGALALRIFWGRTLPASSEVEGPPRRVQSFVGCGHVWRLEAWRSLPPYPAWFEMYGEEAFASYELLRRGWEVHYLPAVLVHHRVEIADRPAAERAWRYRRQLRAGLFLACLFHPRQVLPRHLAYAFREQLRRDRRLSDLVRVAADLVRHAPRLRRERHALSPEQWALWQSLEPEPIYWSPS